MDAKLEPIVPNPGSELDPANFVGRSETTARALDMLEAGQNILVSDPRRMGKTFWMVWFAAKMAAGDRFRVVRIDYQGVASIDEFLRKTAESLAKSQGLPKRFHQYLGGLFDNIEIGAAVGPVTLKMAHQKSASTPLELLGNILARLDHDLADGDGPTLVIAMDEVPDAVESIARNGSPKDGFNLLERLRALRHASSRVRWIVAGSIGFHHVWSACGADEGVINDLNTLAIGPLPPAEAVTLTRRLAQGEAWLPLTDLPEAILADARLGEIVDSLVDDHYLVTHAGGTEVKWRYGVTRTIYRRRRHLGR